MCPANVKCANRVICRETRVIPKNNDKISSNITWTHDLENPFLLDAKVLFQNQGGVIVICKHAVRKVLVARDRNPTHTKKGMYWLLLLRNSMAKSFQLRERLYLGIQAIS